MNISAKKVLFVVRIAVPVALLSIIFSHVKWERLGEILTQINLWYFSLAALIGYIPMVFLAVWRWKYMLAVIAGIRVPYFELMKHWWIGMFLGYFVPASIGMDIYRIVGVARKRGEWIANTSIVVGEKILAVLATMMVLAASYPLIMGGIEAGPQIARLVSWGYAAGLVCAAAFFLVLLIPKLSLGKKALSFVANTVDRHAQKVIARVASGRFEDKDVASPSEVLRPFFRWRTLLAVILFTAAVRLVGSASENIMFLAIGVQLPFLANVFAVTLMFVIFILPISFGSLGVREGAYIAIYALFSVEREAALVVCFLSLACLLLTISIGGIILLVSRGRTETGSESPK